MRIRKTGTQFYFQEGVRVSVLGQPETDQACYHAKGRLPHSVDVMKQQEDTL